MKDDLYTGPVPDQLDIRLERRDTNELPPNALIKFQVINRGKNPQHNYRWVLFEDGRLFFAWHSGSSEDWQTPFDTDLPTSPTTQLKEEIVEEIRQRLQEAEIINQAPYQADKSVQDGGFYIITVRLENESHEVIYEGIYPPLVEFLETIAKGE